MARLLGIILTVLVLLHSTESLAAKKLPRGVYKLASANLFTANLTKGSSLCGLIKGKYLPVEKYKPKKSLYRTTSEALRLLKLQLKAEYSRGATAKKLSSKLKKLNKKYKEAKGICIRGPIVDTPPPSAALQELARPITVDDINHLYRRAGLGVPPAEAYAYLGGPVGPLVDYFMNYVPEPDIEANARQYLDEDPALPNYPDNDATHNGIHMYALQILINTRNQFAEHLALLALHDRLSTSSLTLPTDSRRNLMVNHLDLIRQRGGQQMDYAGLLEEIGEDAVMVKWLTLDLNTKKSPNENYARELMELFSLDTKNSAGESNYSNTDIRQIARAFTGWNLLNQNGDWSVIFTPGSFDSDPNKVIFAGTPYQGVVKTGRDVVRWILTHHPNSAPSLAKFIVRQYLQEAEPAPVILELSDILRANGFNMRAAFSRLLKSEEFYKPANQFSLAQSPTERFVRLVRVMNQVQMPYNFGNLRGSLANMGCVVTQPETVFGCDRLEELPDGQRLLSSINRITSISDSAGAPWNYTRFFPNPAPTSNQMIDQMQALFGIVVTSGQRAAMNDYMNFRLSNTGTLISDPWNPADSAMVRRKGAGLFRIFAGLPQIHDLK